MKRVCVLVVLNWSKLGTVRCTTTFNNLENLQCLYEVWVLTGAYKIIWDPRLPLLGEFQVLLSGRLCGFPKKSYKKKKKEKKRKVDSVGLLSAKFYSAVYVHVLNCLNCSNARSYNTLPLLSQMALSLKHTHLEKMICRSFPGRLCLSFLKNPKGKTR